MTLAPSLVSTARDLLERPDSHTAGIWPRATALLARQALESALDDLWRSRAPGVERCSTRRPNLSSVLSVEAKVLSA